MLTWTKRRIAGVLASALILLVGSGAVARATGLQLPWLQERPVSVVGIAADQPLSLAWRYLPFWHYGDGFAWMEYNNMRYALQAVPPVYAAAPRPADVGKVADGELRPVWPGVKPTPSPTLGLTPSPNLSLIPNPAPSLIPTEPMCPVPIPTPSLSQLPESRRNPR